MFCPLEGRGGLGGEYGWGLCGFAGVAVGAEGDAKGAAEKRVEVGQDGGATEGGDFADGQVGFARQTAAQIAHLWSICGRHELGLDA